MPTDTAEDSKHDMATPDGVEDPILNKTIDGCRVVRKLGAGGMGVVYLAEHESLQQEFVLKILNPALTGAEDTVERFFREAQACAQLNHPGIVAIQNVGQEGEYYFIRMEYVEGITLEDLVKDRNQLDWREATRIVVEVAEALSHAHQKGMIHRDIKPENIMFTPKEEVKVMDFGLAKHVHSSAKVSVTGQIVGTPFFMSPEQAGGKPTDARSDIYSLGVTLYYLVTGVKPFNGKNLQEIFLKHFFYAPESPKIYNESLPDSLCEAVKRCLKKKKKERYQSAKGLARDLAAILDDPDAPLGESKAGAAPADVGGMEDGGKTVATGGDELDATVRVEATDEDGGATVKVTDAEDGEATVAVARKDGQKGEVKTVSFRSASMVFDGNADSTIELDEEDAHAGLDMPTAVLNAMGGGDGSDASSGSIDSEEEKSKTKKKLLGAALVVLLPVLLVVILNVMARSSLTTLSTQYDEAMANSETSTADLQGLKDKLLAWKGTNLLAPKDKADGMLKILEDKITRQKTADAEARQRELAGRKAAAKLKKKRLLKQQLLEDAKKASGELSELREQALEQMGRNEDSSETWASFMKVANKFLEQAVSKRQDYPELERYLADVKFPIFVTSNQAKADIYLNGNPTKIKTGESRPVWVTPSAEYTIRVTKRGFNDFDSGVLTATKQGYVTATLTRKELRGKLKFGRLAIRFGPRTTDEPIVPVHPLALTQAAGKGVAYFVGRGGYLRAFSLKGEGKPLWHKPPQVAEYGDPTPSLFVEPNRIVLVSSLTGHLNAHEPTEGSQLWSTDLGSPVTSPPFYKRAWKIIAVGTAAGDVVFLREEGQVKGRFPTQNPVVSAPYFHGDRFCVAGSTDHRVYSIDWRTNRSPVEVDRLDLGSAVVVGPTKARSMLLVGTEQGQVHAITIDKKGKIKRAKNGVFGREQGRPVTSIVVIGDRVYFTVGRRLYCYELDGRAAWGGKPFEAPSKLTPLLAEGNQSLIYVASLDGMLHAVDRSSGESKWTFKTSLDKGMHLPPFVVGDELYVPAGNKIHVLAAEE